MPLDKNEQVVIDGRKCTVACAISAEIGNGCTGRIVATKGEGDKEIPIVRDVRYGSDGPEFVLPDLKLGQS